MRTFLNKHEAIVIHVLLGIIVSSFYYATARSAYSDDIRGVLLLPLAVAEHQTFGFEPYIQPDEPLPYYLIARGDAVVSRFPIWPAAHLAPFVFAARLAYPDDLERALLFGQQYAALFWMTATVLLLWPLLLRFVPRAPALVGLLLFTFGSPNWTTLSRSFFSNTLAQFWLVIALLLVAGRPKIRWVDAAGALTALLIGTAMRLVMAPMVLLMGVYVLIRMRWRVLPAVVLLAIPAAAIGITNFLYVGHPLGPYGLDLTRGATNFDPAWMLQSLAGNLVSPSRGLVLFAPWLLLAIPGVVGLLRARYRLDCVLLVSLTAAHFVAISPHIHWFGGHSNGPRLSLDMLPAATILTLPALHWLWQRRAGRALGVAIVAVSLVISAAHALGPWSWKHRPVDIDQAPERLWDWNDPLITYPLWNAHTDYEELYPIRLTYPGPREPLMDRNIVLSWSYAAPPDTTYTLIVAPRDMGRFVFEGLTESHFHRKVSWEWLLEAYLHRPVAWQVTARNAGGGLLARSPWRLLPFPQPPADATDQSVAEPPDKEKP